MNKIYVFPVTPHPMGDCVYRAVAEDGEDLADQVSSSEDWGKRDLGVGGAGSQYYKDRYTAKYPDGYQVEYVPDGSTHPVLAKFVQVEKAPNADSVKPDRELDALMAEKVMGWARGDYCWMDTSGVPGYQVTDYTPNGSSTGPEWNPSIDIAMAMEVVEKVKGRRITIQWSSDVSEWCVTLDEAPTRYAHDEKLPRTICCAVRQAKGI